MQGCWDLLSALGAVLPNKNAALSHLCSTVRPLTGNATLYGTHRVWLLPSGILTEGEGT